MLMEMGSGWFKDFLEQSKVQQPQFQSQPSLLHFLTDFKWEGQGPSTLNS